MRRGFKAEAKHLALELRTEISLDAYAPFDPYAFAVGYGIRVIHLPDLDGQAPDYFLRSARSPFSGALIPYLTGVLMEFPCLMKGSVDSGANKSLRRTGFLANYSSQPTVLSGWHGIMQLMNRPPTLIRSASPSHVGE